MENTKQVSQNNSNITGRPGVPIVYPTMGQNNVNDISPFVSNTENSTFQTIQPNTFAMNNVSGQNPYGILPSYPTNQPIAYTAMSHDFGHNQYGGPRPVLHPLVQPSIYPVMIMRNAYGYNPSSFQQPILYPAMHIHSNMSETYVQNQFRFTASEDVNLQYLDSRRMLGQHNYFNAPPSTNTITQRLNNSNYPQSSDSHTLIIGEQNVDASNSFTPFMGHAQIAKPQTSFSHTMIVGKQNVNSLCTSSSLTDHPYPQSSDSHTLIIGEQNFDASNSFTPFMGQAHIAKPQSSFSHTMIVGEQNVNSSCSSPFTGLVYSSVNQSKHFQQSILRNIYNYPTDEAVHKALVVGELYLKHKRCDHKYCLSRLMRSLQELVSSEVTLNPNTENFESEESMMAEHLYNVLYLLCPPAPPAIHVSNVAVAR
ncbi:hypothetical protein HA402_000862 [Bradysia odoriphaga]|nr:hypothetical protein HA402_000862 [Bradysia odoriphaga]